MMACVPWGKALEEPLVMVGVELGLPVPRVSRYCHQRLQAPWDMQADLDKLILILMNYAARPYIQLSQMEDTTRNTTGRCNDM